MPPAVGHPRPARALLTGRLLLDFCFGKNVGHNQLLDMIKSGLVAHGFREVSLSKIDDPPCWPTCCNKILSNHIRKQDIPELRVGFEHSGSLFGLQEKPFMDWIL